MKNLYYGTRLYWIWHDMKRRCTNPNRNNYPAYGGRGITVCEEWQSSTQFCEWAVANGYNDTLTIERVDVNGHYCPANCTFIPKAQQSNNKQDTRYMTAFGETKSRREWSQDPRCRVSYTALKKRTYRGWDDENAISTPERVNKYA
jgi:hypothetical protein